MQKRQKRQQKGLQKERSQGKNEGGKNSKVEVGSRYRRP